MNETTIIPAQPAFMERIIRMRRMLATTALAALLLSSLTACSKEGENGKEPSGTITPTGSAGQNNPDDGPDASFDYVILGGYFVRDDANFTIYISDNGWHVNGALFPKGSSSPLILTGPLTYTEGLDLTYSKDGEELTFTFAKNSMEIKVNKGTAYTAFAGTYTRTEQTPAESSSVSPKSGSLLELIGRIATAHYMAKAEGIPECTVDISAGSYDNTYMTKFVLTYADLFLAAEAQPVPEISADYLCYAFPEEEFNNLLLTATAGTFGANNFDPADSGIVCKNSTYYIPCRGNYAGGLATSYTNADPDAISEHLLLEAVISKKDGTRYDIEMTLTTSENENIGTSGIQMDSVTYKILG